MGEYNQTYSTQVAAPVDACFRVLVDFEQYPQWAEQITLCRVLNRHPDGLARHVAFELNATIKTLRYTLEYAYDAPHGARWHLVEGDVSGVEGSYRFEPSGSGTKATCNQAIDLGFWVPGFIRNTFEAKALQDSVEAFRVAVERQA